MENQRKLELTLCGMLPYGLELINANNEIVSFLGFSKLEGKQDILHYSKRGYESHDLPSSDSGFYTRYYKCPLYSDFKTIENTIIFKPLLHSLSKLTEPILEGGLIPIVELVKPHINIEGFDLRWIGKTIMANEFNILNIETTHLQIEKWELLKSWHFNIYDLPSDMYIEKSTLK